ncbi:MAG: signal recognition particle protein [Actinobacteria bacterium]|uniref:signal-recognition-particle GTPase n=1 Tax=hydrothermal vent metagenome TaxID=652676 RepID=A0A3B0T5J6_9ZZZZ|nr:signal recognition particle protein [Actinomycetota bacterium]
MFDNLTSRFGDVFTSLRSKGRLSETDIDATLREVRLALLEADVNVAVVKTFLARVKERASGEDVTKSLTPGQQIIKIVHEELITTLGGETAELKRPAAPPLVILMVGLQGSGKTTSAAKLAAKLKSRGRRPLLVAADLQRPAAIDQLETLGKRIGVPVYADRKGKTTKLVKAALKQARADSNNVVIIDTAGRLQIDTELMNELSAVQKVSEPHEVLLVVDAMTGQEAVNVAQGFMEHTDLTGLILTKIDGDARGGAAISAREVTGVPIKFVGTGEGIKDLDSFHPDRMASRILGMGDVMSLIEKAEETFDQASAEKAVMKLQKGSFDLEDFLEQFQQLRKMGPLQSLVKMLPGAGQALGDVEINDKDLGRVEAIIRSMTPTERQNPRIINGSRKRRIAQGSGTKPQDVNRLLKQFAESQKMMKSLASGRSPIPGLPMPGGRRRKMR